MKRILVLLGPPGVGKGTVGSALRDRWGLPLLSSGDLLRSDVKSGTELGKRAWEFMERGDLVPDEIVIRLIRQAAEGSPSGFILDGFPRNISQAETLHRMLEAESYRVVYLAAEDSFLVRRLEGRRVCSSCGAIYHLANIPPRRSGVCDRCGAALMQRNDDRPDVIANRLQVYHKATAPLLEYYGKMKILDRVRGDAPLEETLGRIEGVLGW